MAAELIGLASATLTCATLAVGLVSPLGKPLRDGFDVLRKRKQGLADLKSGIEKLERRRREVGEEIYVDRVLSKTSKVLAWLNKVEKFLEDYVAFKFDEKINKKVLGIPKYGARCKAGKEVKKKNEELDDLQKEGDKFIKMEESNVVGQLKDIWSSKKLVGKEAIKKVEEIKNYVMGKAVSSQVEGTRNRVLAILVYGMAGSGKTEVVSAVNDLVLCGIDQVFDKLIWVTVENKGSTQSSIYDLQKKIAEKLDIDFKMAAGNRKETLANALLNKKFLIILDDMWKNLSLEEIGIPRPTKDNGCKLIVITRSSSVCSDTTFKKIEIKPLSDPEAVKELFECEAGDIKLSELSQTARDNANKLIGECEGLPLAIISLAQTLTDLKKDDSNSNVAAWNAALEGIEPQLEHIHDRLSQRLKDSYGDMLKDDAKTCFLYCALYPTGHPMNKKELVEYWFWEGLLDGKDRCGPIEDMKRATEILEELMGAYLLEEVDKEQIKMRYLARCMAVHLTSTSPGKFLIKANEGLSHWDLREQGSHEVERASMMRNDIKAIIGESKFPMLSTLLMQHNPISHLPENLFSNMPNIKVLDLSYTNISTLPPSASSHLTKLRALLLQRCLELESLPSLANSKELLVLDLSHTSIKKLPDGLNALAKLIRLNLSGTIVGEFEEELVCKLESLEELLMITITKDPEASLWKSEKTIKNLGAITSLAVLHINFVGVKAFETYLGFSKHYLSKFIFCVGGSCNKILPDNSIFIEGNFFESGKPVSVPVDTSELHVMSNNDLSSLPSCHLNHLKVINVSGCARLVYLFKWDVSFKLPSLEKISVENCQNMEALMSKEDPLQFPLRFSKLKEIHISKCKKLGYLFRIEMDSSHSTSDQKEEYSAFFLHLEEISITRHQEMKLEKGLIESDVNSFIHPKLLDRLLVDPVELKRYFKFEEGNNHEGPFWHFPDLKMKIKNSLPEEPHPLLSGTEPTERSPRLGSMSMASTSTEENGDLVHSNGVLTLANGDSKQQLMSISSRPQFTAEG